MTSTTTPARTPASESTTQVVGHIDDLSVGEMKMSKVGDRRIALIRTPSGVHALDNACPHQGYGLVTGSLDGELVTCQWHNWKFRASDGTCVRGEEDVACHSVEVTPDGSIAVTVDTPTPEQEQAALWPSLDAGFDNHYIGQMSRDTARLLRAGATPEQLVARQVARSQPREEYGVGHGLAMATDCLALTDLYDGDDQTLPVMQALSALAERTRFRPSRPVAEPDPSRDLATAIEAEDVDCAVAAVRGRVASGASPEDLLPDLALAVGAHHLSYGHGAIYIQKCFELLDRVGWEHADEVLPHLVTSLVYGTREDTLPYMRTAVAAIDRIDLDTLAIAERDPDWQGAHALASAMLDSPEAAIEAAADAAGSGGGVTGVLDAVTLSVSERMLRYDLTTEFDLHNDFGWLDITHGITYANAARWLCERVPGPATARLALFTVFLAHDTGRGERWGLYQPLAKDSSSAPSATSATSATSEAGTDVTANALAEAILERRADEAVALALDGPRHHVAETLARTSLLDRSSSWIVAAHIVKLAVAADVEARATGSSLPLAAAARFAAAPRLERFVASNVAAALDFVRTGRPPRR